MSMRSEYGPEVVCDFTDNIELTHRPAGSGDPWFCFACGSTSHIVAFVPGLKPHKTNDYRPRCAECDAPLVPAHGVPAWASGRWADENGSVRCGLRSHEPSSEQSVTR